MIDEFDCIRSDGVLRDPVTSRRFSNDEIRAKLIEKLHSKDAYAKMHHGDKEVKLRTTGNIKIIRGGLDNGQAFIEYKRMFRKHWMNISKITWANKREEEVCNIKDFPEEMI